MTKKAKEEEPKAKEEEPTQSEGLSKRLKKHYKDGNNLITDSKPSEKNLTNAIDELLLYLHEKYHPATFEVRKEISCFECEQYYHAKWPDFTPTPNPEHKRYSMKPDGALIVMKLNDNKIPILITEDKIQGTNDKNKIEGSNKKPQATGNAIERSAKNIRGAEMIFSELSVFPYIIFCHGCDFHHTESIQGRLIMMNYGEPNHYIEITPDSTEECVDEKIDNIIEDISIKKRPNGKDVASFFVKGHKWDECEHGASNWTVKQRVKILKKVVDLVLKSVLE